jgi:hypothetical protein
MYIFRPRTRTGGFAHGDRFCVGARARTATPLPDG